MWNFCRNKGQDRSFLPEVKERQVLKQEQKIKVNVKRYQGSDFSNLGIENFACGKFEDWI